MERLYVPLLPAGYSGSRPGPLGAFAAQALASLGPDAERLWTRADEEPVDDRPVAAQTAARTEASDAPDREDLLRLAREAFAARRRLESFSGLARRAGAAAPAAPADVLLAEDGTRLLREDSTEEPEGAGEGVPAEKNHPARIGREDLPSGAAAGNALHKLLEHLDFASVLTPDSPESWLEQPGRRASVDDILRAEGLDTAHAGAAARAVWNTLRMPLPDPAGGPAFRLAETADRRPELEFLFPYSPQKNNAAFLQGFIDLVFRHAGRYYLLDWKSNLLEDYGEAGIAASMRHHRYDLQAQIYAVALDRWLAARVPDYDPARHFGGVYYLYLRGASPDRFCGHAHRPSPEDLRVKFPAALEAALGLRAEERS
jgi:exodeoxyribonuclease V beta subunit